MSYYALEYKSNTKIGKNGYIAILWESIQTLIYIPAKIKPIWCFCAKTLLLLHRDSLRNFTEIHCLYSVGLFPCVPLLNSRPLQN